MHPEHDFIYGVTEGLMLIEKNKLMDYAMPDGRIHIPILYTMAMEFYEGWATVSNEE